MKRKNKKMEKINTKQAKSSQNGRKSKKKQTKTKIRDDEGTRLEARWITGARQDYR